MYIQTKEPGAVSLWAFCILLFCCGQIEGVRSRGVENLLPDFCKRKSSPSILESEPCKAKMVTVSVEFRMDNCRVVFSFTKKEISTRQGQDLFLFFIIQLSGSRSFPLTSCAFSDLFLSRCSIASCFHTFPHLRLSEATQNPCPLCRLSTYRGTR